MSNLSRVNFVGQMRLDVPHLMAMESFTSADFRALIQFMSGISTTYIIRGLEAVSSNGLNLSFETKDSITFNPADANGSFYLGLSDDADITLTLPSNQTSVFIEAIFETETRAPVNNNQWNPLALTSVSNAGSEYTASIDSQKVIKLTLSSNTIGFTEGAIPIAKVKTSATTIDSIQDCRPLLFRLGTGGSNPDPNNRFDWATVRQEPVLSGTGVDQASNSSFRSYSNGVMNDKGIKSLKEFFDAVLTVIAEIKGCIWYENGLTSGFLTGITLNQLMFDTIGHNIQPSQNASILWSYTGDGFLRSHGTEPVKWRSNYRPIEWTLGGSFVDILHRDYGATPANNRFISPAVSDGQNVYVLLEREVNKGSGNAVIWISDPISGAVPPSYPAGWATNTIVWSDSTDDFTGIAVGDYIRKSSQGISQYYKVIGLGQDSTDLTATGLIATSVVNRVRLDRVIDSASRESLKFFRAAYSNTDIIVNDGSAIPSTDYYWVGRRAGDFFVLRNYGMLSEGEEAYAADDSCEINIAQSPLAFVHMSGAQFSTARDYELEAGSLSPYILVIARRITENMTATPGPADNSGSALTYWIPAASLPINIPSGSSLWVRFSNTAGGALSAGTVYSSAEDENNQQVTTLNKFEVITAANSPLKTFNNDNLYKIAASTTINGVPCLLFVDGSILQEDGQYIPNHLAIQGYTKVKGGLADDDAVIPIPFADAVYNVPNTEIGGTSVIGMIGKLAQSQSDETNTGFVSWDGAGPYYSLVANVFTLLQSGDGRIKGKEVSWASGQSLTFGAGYEDTTYYLYINSSGVLSRDANYPDASVGVPLFEIFYDGTNYYVVKENHPYSFNTKASRYLHNNVGTVIRGLGALLDKVGSGTGASVDDRKTAIAGNDVLEDHGLETDIPDSGGVGVTWAMYYWDVVSNFTRYISTDEYPMVYNAAGTITAIPSGEFGVFTCYVTKSDLNTTTPQYFLVIGDASYATENDAEIAINSGLVPGMHSAEASQLAKLEFAQLGYVIVENNGSGGYIHTVIIAKSTFNSKVVGGGNQGSGALISLDTTDFDGILSGVDSTVQTAMETIDDYCKTSNFKIIDHTNPAKQLWVNLSNSTGSHNLYAMDHDYMLPIDPVVGDTGKFLMATGVHTAVWTPGDGVPVGTIIPWIGGYYQDGVNGTYTPVLSADTIVAIKAFLASNYPNWWVCDGTEPNDAVSPIFNALGRYVPNLTDSRFLMGNTTVGAGVGGSNSRTTTVPASGLTVSGSTTWASSTVTTSGGSATFNKNVMNTDAISHTHGSGSICACLSNTGGNQYTREIATDTWTSNVYTVNGGENASTVMRNEGLDTVGSTSGNYPTWNSSTVTTTFTQPNFNKNVMNTNQTWSGSVAGTATTASFDNRPAYLSCIYLIRIK